MEKTLFYKELGRLLYAIAAADGRVQRKEGETLEWVVKDLLVPVESGLDHHGTDMAYITEFEFDVLADRHATSQEAFDSFVAYMSGHHKDLTGEQRELVLTCAEAVAHAYHGVGAKELPLLIELNKHLRQG